MSMRLGDLAQAVGVELRGDPNCLIDRIAPLPDAGEGAISFLNDRKYEAYLAQTKASAVILTPDQASDCPVPALLSNNPYLSYAKVGALLYPPPPVVPGIHPSAVVDPSAEIDAGASIAAQCVIEAHVRIAPGVSIGPGCIVGAGSEIGEGTRLVARVTVCRDSVIGRRCLIHPGAVIGSDGFGLANDQGRWVKIPQIGRAVLGDDVEIGANTTVDRGAIGDTRIDDGAKLDNLIQIGHNVHIGEHSALAGCVGIAGSAHVGKRCMIAGGVGIAGHLEIADNVTVTGMSLVTKSLKEPGVYSSGVAVQPAAKWRKNYARFANLDELARRLKALEKKSE